MIDDDVLDVVKRIPKGKVTTYKEIARALNSRAYRTVGQALKRNPRPIEIPCHRVVCSDGELGGYSGQMNSRRKITLLKKEGVVLKKGRVDMKKFFWKP